jgi:hypothetical protein
VITSGPRPSVKAVNRFMVERYLPGAKPELLDRDVRLLAAAADGTRYLGSTFVPEEEACFSWFEAESVDAVRSACERAGIDPARIVETRELPNGPHLDLDRRVERSD